MQVTKSPIKLFFIYQNGNKRYKMGLLIVIKVNKHVYNVSSKKIQTVERISQRWRLLHCLAHTKSLEKRNTLLLIIIYYKYTGICYKYIIINPITSTLVSAINTLLLILLQVHWYLL